MARRQIKQSYDMLVTNSNHIFLLDNREGFSLVIFFCECQPSWKSAQMSTLAENLRLLSVGFEI